MRLSDIFSERVLWVSKARDCQDLRLSLPERFLRAGDIAQALRLARLETAVSGYPAELPRDAVQEAFRNYLDTCDTYGTYEERSAEYQIVARQLRVMGLRDGDSILDVGAGSCDMDHYLRTEGEWRGQYMPVDGSLLGDSLDQWEIPDGVQFDWVVCVEAIEHVHDPERLFGQLLKAARSGVVVATPNPAVVDVLAVDPTHQSAVSLDDLEAWSGGRVTGVGTFNFNGRGGSEEDGWDTIVFMAYT